MKLRHSPIAPPLLPPKREGTFLSRGHSGLLVERRGPGRALRVLSGGAGGRQKLTGRRPRGRGAPTRGAKAPGRGAPPRRGGNPRAGLQADGGLSQGSHRGAGVFAIVLITALSFSVWSSRGDSGDARCPGLGASDREIGAGVGWRSGPWAGCRTPPRGPLRRALSW